VAEAVALLRDLGAEPAAGGPLSDQRGVVWVTLPAGHLLAATPRLQRLGYAEAVDLLVTEDELRAGGASGGRRLRWRGRPHRLLPLYREDRDLARERAPDRREFRLETPDRRERTFRGYRGGRGPTAHRALPVSDARLLVNLVAAPAVGVLLDPFAGAGGVVIEAVASGWLVVSADLDPTLRHGLAGAGARHLVADARRLPLAGGCVDAVATEPPYDPGQGELVAEAVPELGRVLRPGGRAALLCAEWQAAGLQRAAAATGLAPELRAPIDRKGLAVELLLWRRP
jgi:SAM-dependent methyltransferase